MNFLKNRAILLLCVLLSGFSLIAQVTQPIAAPSDTRSGLFAITAGEIYITPSRVLKDATLLIKDGKVVNVGVGIKVPADAVKITYPDKTILPGFIDLLSSEGLDAPKRKKRHSRSPQYNSSETGPFAWNEALSPEYNAASEIKLEPKKLDALRKLGVTTVLSHNKDGISRGTGALINLSKKPIHEQLLKAKAAHVLSLRKGTSNQAYPSSQMGSIALLRQTYLDGNWYKSPQNKKEQNLSLEAWNEVQKLPQFFEVKDVLEAQRALQVAKEFNKKYIIFGNGDEYQRLDGFEKGQNFVIPLTFPAAFDIKDPYDAQMVDYTDLIHWERAPLNARYLKEAGLNYAFTLDGLKKTNKDFFGKIEELYKRGLSEQDILAALTIVPAKYINAHQDLGSLENGKIANFVVVDQWPVKATSKVYSTWVQGQAFAYNALNPNLPNGMYRIDIENGASYTLLVDKKGKGNIVIGKDSSAIKVNIKRESDRVSLHFKTDTLDTAPSIRLSGHVDKLSNLSGKGYNQKGDWIQWAGTFDQESRKRVDHQPIKRNEPEELKKVMMPFAPYGKVQMPKSTSFVIKNATVWTNEADGILENADVFVENGKIVRVGKNLKVAAGIKSIDGTGKHLTSGIIDEHSHIAISKGVNEGTQESSAEVRIGDVVNSEDVNIYRHLSGGVTALQLLHGSANPIGGQSALVKLRWGSLPEQMKIKGADGFIKFALGENVKQSNWNIGYNTRYPQTRMGVEQVFDDYFTRAREYYNERKKNPSTRRDLDLETVAEIINKERFITCHSYRQSEINMLMTVAERHNFRVNTFTHILEGYKVADKMKKHGVGASTFSDWWAYKFEVWDAIPENGAIMHNNGIVVAFNSDDVELGRRLNQEAAKAVQYGDLSEEEAWKFVTLNPAKLLHLDDRMGSIKSGKDADLVIWNQNPLSVYAVAEATWIDGVKYFDREEMKELHQQMQNETNRLVQEMMNDKLKGKPVRPIEAKGGEHYHCNSLEGQASEHNHHH